MLPFKITDSSDSKTAISQGNTIKQNMIVRVRTNEIQVPTFAL